ncbi:MAG TPA: endopeptidase La [Thermotogaceae bacterium]|nr:endopeptidase La [Thermotogota bacterium]HEW92986.1 endopeptidase La [Thermotogaceae bacterium]
MSRIDEFINEQDQINIPEILPVVALREGPVMFPGAVLPFIAERNITLAAIEYSLDKTNRLVFLTWQKDPDIEKPKTKDLIEFGVIAQVIQIFKNSDGSLKVLVEILKRAILKNNIKRKNFLLFKVEPLDIKYRKTKYLRALMRKVRELFAQYVEMTQTIPKEVTIPLEEIDDPEQFADMIASVIPGRFEEKIGLLQELHPKNRLEKILQMLENELQLLKLEEKINERVKSSIEKSQREFYLKEKLRAIQEELSGENEDTELAQLRIRIEKLDAPSYVKEKAKNELERLSMMSPYSAEANVIRTYLDWVLNLPWHKTTQDMLDIDLAKKILDEDHYGLQEVKERILEYLAVRKISNNLKSPILCLVGPPGVGKTSLGKSLARAMNRKFVRMSLGGLRDEAEIRGHRRTYVGALPGRIIQLIRQAGSKNPVILLDEIDKMGISFQGDPASALLEVLDPEQNSNFVDHYLELPFDLSNVIFITTANVTYSIPSALLDRMEVIEIPGYTDLEKLMIARKYLIPRLLKEHGLEKYKVSIQEAALMDLISKYTKEAGVRNLYRELSRLFRRVALKIVRENAKLVRITPKILEKMLGTPRFLEDEKLRRPEVGVAIGMAWTPIGGTILQIESAIIPGKGSLILTGQLGDVMKESAQIAISVVRRLCKKLNPEFFNKHDIHIHVPEGAVPKDGPSAGVTIVTSLLSAIKNVPVKNNLSMTGEITLRGRVLPVGGIREKVLAALRSGINEIIIPSKNKKDLQKVPKEILEGVKINLVSNIEEVIEIAIDGVDKVVDKEC